MIGIYVGRNIKRKEEKMEGENLYFYFFVMFFSLFFFFGILGFGEGVFVMIIFFELLVGEFSFGFLIFIGVGL